MKFKVGDIIVNNDKENSYAWTTKEQHFVGEVVEVDNSRGGDDIKVTILKCDVKDEIGKSYYVSSEYFMLTEFEKDYVEFGDIIVLRNGQIYVYADNYIYGEYDSYYLDCGCFDDFKDDLTYYDEREYDIMEIRRNGNCIYRRNNKVEKMTVKDICKELGYDIEIIKED